MPIATYQRSFRREDAGEGRRLVLRSEQSPVVELCFDGVRLSDVPALCSTLVLDTPVSGEGEGVRRWRLEVAGASHHVEARALRIHEARPLLFSSSLQRFALSAHERRVGLVLVRLLRLPGAARLLRWWHARRTR